MEIAVHSELAYWVWLLQVMGSHNPRSHKLLAQYGDAKEIYRAIAERGEVCSILTATEQRLALKTPLEQAQHLIERCGEQGVTILPISEESYPQRLKSIFNPPILLFCMGDLSYIDDSVAVTIVGTREPSSYSVRVAKELCGALARLGAVIVSGFALGLDSVAHGAALAHKERTVAVLGCGLDYNYPKRNASLKKIIAKNGAVISEFLPGERPKPGNFPQRNRIMAGLSLGTLVIEAGRKSGSLITAELSLQQGRDLFCVPPADIFDERYAGVIKYLREGAIPVFSHLDIVYEYYESFSHKISAIHAADTDQSLVYAPTQTKASTSRKKENDAKEESAPAEPEIPYESLSQEQSRIIDLIKERSLLADEIAVLSQLPIETVLSELTELELMDLVISASGQRYIIKA